MIRLVSKELSEATLKQLQVLQETVNAEASFAERASKAKALWNSKGGKDGEKSFEEIIKVLESMCVSVEICNYCEQNEGNDIEHIYPKSFFPENTFDWNNYLLACKQCNSGYKLDECHVLDNNNEVMKVKRGEEPAYKSVAFINPRIEDPNSFMLLNTESFKFEILPEIGVMNERKSEKTIDILELNTRATLLETRKKAATYYYERMERLTRVLQANSIEDIHQILTPYEECLDIGVSVVELKDTIKDGFRRDIQFHSHPSVWHSIKTIESKVKAKWVRLFEILPEALNW